MGFDKPSDLFLMVGVASLAMFIVSMGLVSIQTEQNATLTPGLEDRFKVINDSIAGNLTQARGEVNNALSDQTGAGDKETEDGLIVRSWNSIKSLSEAYTVAEHNMGDFSRAIGLSDTVWGLAIGMLLVVFSVVVYGYIRGIR